MSSKASRVRLGCACAPLIDYLHYRVVMSLTMLAACAQCHYDLGFFSSPEHTEVA